MICPICGYESLDPNEKVCPYCGYVFPVENEVIEKENISSIEESAVYFDTDSQTEEVIDDSSRVESNIVSIEEDKEAVRSEENCSGTIEGNTLSEDIEEATVAKRSAKGIVLKVLGIVAAVAVIAVLVLFIRNKIIEHRTAKEAQNDDIIVSDENNDENDSSDEMIHEVTVEFLVSILNTRTTVEDLKQDGYELSYEGALNFKTKAIKLYSFKDCDVVLFVSGYDQTRLYNYDHFIEEAPEKLPEIVNEADLVVVAVQGPASILLPNKIGEIGNQYIEEDVMYCPNCNFWSYGFALCIDYLPFEEIEDNTSVCIFTQTGIGEVNYNYIRESIELFVEVFRPEDEDYSDDTDDNFEDIDDSTYIFRYEEYGIDMIMYRIDGYETDEFWRIFNIDIYHRELTEEDLITFTPKELTYLRNSIYAAHLYAFKSRELYDYFGQYSWYNPEIEADNFTEGAFSEIEKYNVDFIRKYQSENGLEYTPQ